MNNEKPFGWKDKIGYALGDFGCNMSFAFINSYMMLFFVTCLGIDPKHYAIIIMIAKVWDAVNDPIIGALCDASHPKGGSKFKPWIQWGCIPLLISSIVMFVYIPNAPYAAKIALCLVTYLIWSVAYTSVNVPYGSMQSVITRDDLQRAELSNARSIGALIAQLPVMVILPLIIFDKENQPKGNMFIYVVAVMGIIGVGAFLLMCRMTTERIKPADNKAQKFNYFKTLGSFFTNRPIMVLTVSTVSYLALIMTVTSSMQYIFMYYFKNSNLISVATVIAGAPMVVAIILVKPLVKRFSKKVLCTYPFLAGIIATGIITFFKFTNPYIWLVFVAIAVLSAGLYMVLIWAMVADSIDYQEKKTGRREEGSIYATYSLFRKLAQGIGSAAVSLAIGWTGYEAALGANQAAGVADKIYFVTGLLPFLGTIICFVSMLFYNIDEKKSVTEE